MLTNSLTDLYFSASALQTYETCKLKFRRRYIDGLYWPSDWVRDEEDKKIYETGQQFHTLAERYYTHGQIVDPKELMSQELVSWLERLTEFRPYTEEGRLLPEQELRFAKGDLKLLAKYDLLYISPAGQAVIYDWKTNEHQLKEDYWADSLQTLVYRYLLTKAGGAYAPTDSWQPEDITLVYWNPRFPNQKLELYYNQAQFSRDEERLIDLMTEIKNREYDEFFGVDNKRCHYCEYRPICHGQEALEIKLAEEDLELDVSWEEIDELEF
ncbi:PD-(D/E)XK nuclease family protein [Halanaerobaculum tunisiense]